MIQAHGILLFSNKEKLTFNTILGKCERMVTIWTEKTILFKQGSNYGGHFVDG